MVTVEQYRKKLNWLEIAKEQWDLVLDAPDAAIMPSLGVCGKI